MGAFSDRFRRKKAMPFEPRVDFEEPRPTFIDPTRTIAAQSEQANIASQAVGQFAGPQGLNARLSQIQGQAGKQAADTLSNVNNQNVGIANQFEQAQSNIRNQETQALIFYRLKISIRLIFYHFCHLHPIKSSQVQILFYKHQRNLLLIRSMLVGLLLYFVGIHKSCLEDSFHRLLFFSRFLISFLALFFLIFLGC